MGCIVDKEKFETKMGAKIDSFSDNYVYYYKDTNPNVKMKMQVDKACIIAPPMKKEEVVKE